MAHGIFSRRSRDRLRYVPLLAAGALVFLGIVFLGSLSGLLWHIRMFDRWVPLSPFIVSRTIDWFVWSVCFFTSVSPAVLVLFSKRTKRDPVMILTSFALPLLSMSALIWSYYVGAALLVGSGFLVAYTLVSRSELILNIPKRSALRLVATEVFMVLAVAAAGGVASILQGQGEALVSLILGHDLNDTWARILTLDMEAFYLARPFLVVAFVVLGVAAVVALFRPPLQWITDLLVRQLMRGKHRATSNVSKSTPLQSGRSIVVRGLLPYVILAASLLLGTAITTYPYGVARVATVIGSDSWWYLRELSLMHTFADIPPRLETDRGFFLLLLFLVKTTTGLNAQSLLEWMPALLSALLAISSFVLTKEGTGRSWPAGFVALLSVVSAQTSLGMSAFIITNWFALSIANFMLALVVRSIKRRSMFSTAGALIFSLLLLASYAFLWVVIIVELALVLLASILPFRDLNRREWMREVGYLGGVLIGSVLTPIAFLSLVVMPLLGLRPQGLDVSAWLTMGWNYLAQGATPQVLGSALTALEEAFDFAGNRADLPFLTLLSIVGLLDQGSQHRSFGRIIAAMTLVPVVITMITPGLFHTWRGLYIVPMYVTGALGAESIIRRVNGQDSPWSPSRLAFAVAFTAYLFLSQLGYSLRALELLILVAS